MKDFHGKKGRKRDREGAGGLVDLNDPALGAVYAPGINLLPGLPLLLSTFKQHTHVHTFPPATTAPCSAHERKTTTEDLLACRA